MTARGLLIAAGISGALAVAFGAFGAHALADAVPVDRLATWRTGSTYHLAHALAIGLSAVVSRQHGRAEASGVLFLVGTVLFSGSLYALVLFDASWLGAVAPLGGLAYIAGWVWLAWVSWREG